jgi:hypothetical protein
MSKKTFNPAEWKPVETIHESSQNPPKGKDTLHVSRTSLSTSPSDIEQITRRIEQSAIDIATNYADWRDLGFALADALGESGRQYYHRLSRFYPSYSPSETDKQFDNCLKAHGHGITIKTLFYLAKQAGIEISNLQIAKLPNCQNGNLAILEKSKSITLQNTDEIKTDSSQSSSEELEDTSLPTFPEEIYPLLPDFLQQITHYAISPEDADLLLLGSLVVLSACMPNVYGIYGGVTVYPNLFLFVSAQASAGKGRLTLCRRLVEPVHRQLRELNKLEYEEYKRQQTEYAVNKKNPDVEEPQEPPLRMLFIPANSSATAVFQILNDNQGVGLMFETEGDTLAQTFKSEHGNYSDGFRKAFHHEKISYLRRKDREYVTLDIPKLSALLSGTPRQIQSLIPDAENGLFSRFIFYCMNIRLQWMDVFACNEDESLDQRFDRLGERFFDFYGFLKKAGNIRFSFSHTQQTVFNTYFEKVQQQYWELLGSDYLGSVRRLGLITFRLAMVLTVLRIMDTSCFSHGLVCSDDDFHIVMEMVKVLLQHSAYVFRQLPQSTQTQPAANNPKMAFYEALPAQFSRPQYLKIASRLQIPESSADKQIARFCNAGLLIRQTHGNYVKGKFKDD